MRLVYCIHSTYNPGGMERVLLNKVRYLVAKGGYQISVVTTDQKGRPSFYPFPEEVKMTDLDINYTDDKFKDPLTKITGYFRQSLSILHNQESVTVPLLLNISLHLEKS